MYTYTLFSVRVRPLVGWGVLLIHIFVFSWFIFGSSVQFLSGACALYARCARLIPCLPPCLRPWCFCASSACALLLHCACASTPLSGAAAFYIFA
ncbi:hypothetical protein DFP72DRAFT_361552 [Ephemerocybe angulata]|uniref:Uncharacterized protein n=1 Tax=Ephemerocybe angulata TaxID=980116 RepID=A0A8H6HWR8_9AGAR|nr:hypothetical protein DFP72DRAFT_361552 [Tulosesus angulatus]